MHTACEEASPDERLPMGGCGENSLGAGVSNFLKIELNGKLGSLVLFFSFPDEDSNSALNCIGSSCQRK